MLRLLTIELVLVSTAIASVGAQPPQFETHVRAILKEHCFQCHGEEPEVQGNLDLRLVRFMKTGGDSGPAIVSGRADESLLFERVLDGEMPPEEGQRLNDDEIALLREWIEAGATTVRPEPETIHPSFLITDEERAHWAFQPIQRPDIPNVVRSDQISSPIDAFLLAPLEEHGFSFSPRASARVLSRRLSFDLHGLPPAPEDVTCFEQRSDDDAWRERIDVLLTSPHYGERWAQHWLDVAGYADSEGYNDADTERPHAWRYRDYVIRAFLSNKPFDEFITEQLAGDELLESPLNNLAARDVERLTATGFLRTAEDGTGGPVADAAVARNNTIADTVRIVTSSLMGMTVGCAQCHDHRYDPIPQTDYYRFRAIFDPALNWKTWKNPQQRKVSLYTDEDRAAAAIVETEAKKVEAERTKKQAEFIAATFEKQLSQVPVDIHEAARAAHSTAANKRTDDQKALFQRYPQLNVTAGSLYLYNRKAADELKAMTTKAAEVRKKKPDEGFVRALAEIPGATVASHVFFRGDHQQPKEEVQPAGLSVLSRLSNLSGIPANNDEKPTTGRRLALARRLTSPAYPLTARVIVNRIWLHHFGRGLVSTPGDFGVLGQPPTHPELLDWLAAEFIDSGWDVQHLHRLILTSTAWRQQVECSNELQEADPENRWYGRASLRRLDAEAVRDSMLFVCGRLNTKTHGPPVPVMADQSGRIVIGQQNYQGETPGEHIDMQGEQFRRSIYVQVRRSRSLAVLKTFDRPAMAPNCELRQSSTVSPQSLLIMNSDLVLEYSRAWAARLQKEAGDDRKSQIQRAWQQAWSRSPNDSESSTAVEFLEEQTAVFAAQADWQPKEGKPPVRTAGQEALAVMCQMMLGSNEFLYVE